MHAELKKGCYWVGYIDWNVRDFHGYRTNRGSTYNAYLIRDTKTALVDTVKAPYVSSLLGNVAELTDLSSLDYVICNHAEPDHSGGLPEVMKQCPNAELVCTQKCREALVGYYDTTHWTFRNIADGDSLSLGNRTLTFLETPMVHWPESIFTIVSGENLLFSMDAFGQHYASYGRFDDEEPFEVVMEEAKVYYANILMLYGKQISRVLDRADGLELGMIAPSHGVIWRTHINAVVSAYRDWVHCKPNPKVLVIYDTMWKSTERMAEAIAEGAAAPGVRTKLLNVRFTDITNLATEVLDAAAIAFGSPTLNSTLMPKMAELLTYLKGLRPEGKAGFAFGSFGWARGGARDVADYMDSMNFELLREPLQTQFAPSDQVLEECREAGKLLAARAEKYIKSTTS